MRPHSFFAFLIFLGFCQFLNPILLQAQGKGAIRGNLTNRKTGQIINTGKLKLIPTGRKKAQILETQPTENGTFIFREVPEGIYDLEYKNPSVYKTQRLVGLYVKNEGQKLAYFRLNDAMIGADSNQVEYIQTYASLQANKEKSIQTASLSEDKLVDAPATVYLITEEDILEQGLQSLNDVLELIPSIEIQDKASYYANNIHSIRGIHGTKKFIILLDGVRISSFTSYLSMYDKNLFIGNAAQIEILLGPASTLYGADAMTGVINIISRKVQNTAISASQSSGRFGTQTYNVFASFKTDKLSFFANGNFYKSEEPALPDFYPESYDWYINHYSKTGAMQIPREDSVILPIHAYKSPRTAHWLNACVSGKNWEIGGQFNRQQINVNVGIESDFSYIDPKTVGITNSSNLYGKYQYKKGKISLESLLNFNYNEVSPKTNFFTRASTGYTRAYIYSFDRTIQASQLMDYQASPKHKLQAGITLNYTQALPTNYAPFYEPFKRFGIRKQLENIPYMGSQVVWENGRDTQVTYNLQLAQQINFGIFAQHRFQLSRKLVFTTGARLDVVRQLKTYLNPTLKLGFIYAASNNIAIKFYGGNAFLAPALEHVHGSTFQFFPILNAQNRATSYIIPNATLANKNIKPEHLVNLETNISYSKNNLFLTANIFTNFLINGVEYRAVAPNNIDTFRISDTRIRVLNADKYVNQLASNGSGFSVQAEYKEKFGKNEQWEFKFSGSYALIGGITVWSPNVVITDTSTFGLLRLPYIATHTLKGGLTIRCKDFSINLRTIYRSPSYNPGTTTFGGNSGDSIIINQAKNPAYAILNLHLNYRLQPFKNNNWYADFFLSIRNLTDTRYYNPTVNLPSSMGIAPQDPLRWSLGLRFGAFK